MKISPQGLDHIKKWEGLELQSYKDPVGIWTIGYGDTGPHVKAGQKITKAEASKRLRNRVDNEFGAAVNRLVKVELKQNQFDALVGLAYNIGVGAFRRSTLLRKLNKGDYDAVPTQIMRWNKGGGRVIKGLTNRRISEVELWNKSSPDVQVAKVKVEEPKGTPATQSTTIFASILIAISTMLEPLKSVASSIGELKHSLDFVPDWALYAVILLAVAWIVRERIRHAKDYGA